MCPLPIEEDPAESHAHPLPSLDWHRVALHRTSPPYTYQWWTCISLCVSVLTFSCRWRREPSHEGRSARCGFAALPAALGPDGTIIGLDCSPQLLTVAAHRVTRRRWDNVELINASAATARLSPRADAALFTSTHTVCSAATVANIVSQLRPGAAVAAWLETVVPRSRGGSVRMSDEMIAARQTTRAAGR